MKLPIETAARHGLALILVAALAACGSAGRHDGLASAPAGPVRASGPAADYPVVVGEPYRVGNTLYTPVDTLNYDEVGYVAADAGSGVTGSHHTLPLPSYVEVTSLVTGKTILVRLERRGPMNGKAVVALSPAALAQLGASAGDPVRVRRVNPPEDERAVLRAGQTAPARMDTPASLVAVLKRRLPVEGSASLMPAKSATPAAIAAVDVPASAAVQKPPVDLAPVKSPAPTPVATQAASAKPSTGLTLPPLPSGGSVAAVVAPAPAPAPATRQQAPKQPPRVAQESSGAFIVQAATMSTLDRAQKVAGAIGGSVTKSGKYFRVRTGPFATREQAEASLAKVRAAGYSDARIFTNG